MAIIPYSYLDENMRELRSRLPIGRPQKPGSYTGGPTAGQFGMMSQTAPTAQEQEAFTQRNIARSQYGQAWQGGGFPRYSGGIAQRLEEDKRNKEALEARRKMWEDKLKERDIAVKEGTLAEKRKQGEWERAGGAMGVGGTAQQTPSAPSTSGPAHATASAATTPDVAPTAPKSEAVPSAMTQLANGQQAYSTGNGFPGAERTRLSDMPPGSARITVPAGSANRPNALGGVTGREGVYEMNPAGRVRYTYTGPVDENAYQPSPGPPAKTVFRDTTTTPTSGPATPQPPVLDEAKKRREVLSPAVPVPVYSQNKAVQSPMSLSVYPPTEQPIHAAARESLAPISRAGEYQKKHLKWLLDLLGIKGDNKEATDVLNRFGIYP